MTLNQIRSLSYLQDEDITVTINFTHGVFRAYQYMNPSLCHGHLLSFSRLVCENIRFSSPGFEPGPHWREASALTVRDPYSPFSIFYFLLFIIFKLSSHDLGICFAKCNTSCISFALGESSFNLESSLS